ncbi:MULTISPECIES: cytosine permease [Pseudomonas]|uniref:Cytosine permease n=1 Tax=Pseudomonas donghuensis TaxID=1163398 RepID=A0AAP0X8W6_9PSED|nr:MULTISPECIES: cytosine permease [Pseudomonas]MDF9894212.1 NCS1 family nucleobase:cation symporter-1 [Pseudomonas vranovensis]KDN98515.1 cytosine permease [Pseudomonas donghuensis]MBF4211231.1 cytosine permease [Pseudomonas donghuensis]MBS7596642.1 cytosine permease [Pseudomonas sp. RC2C2]MCP6692124.1 cytosine permease [Pseudomonas donghuensis]
MTQANASRSKPLIERRSIDYIPENERHGRLYSQFTLWLGANLQITAIVTGALAVVLGGDVFWSLIGLLLGQLVGGAVMALHAAQGPKLGLPQMISSRVQFGVYGAAIPIALVCLMYLGFTATGTVLSGQAIGQLLSVSDSAGILIFAGVIVLATVFGYRMIHWIGRVASVLGIIAFVYLFSRIMVISDIGQLLENRHFTWASFLLAVSLSASWQISFGPYVADYSRYLPSNTSSFKTFLAAGLGSVVGAQASMVLGVFAAAIANGQFSGREVAYIVGLGGTGATAALLYFSIAFGKVTISTLNSYGSFMCIATIISGFRGHIEVTRRQRLFFVLAIVGASTLIALLGQHSFLAAFKSFILFLLTFFVPWSAVNLVDYYFITKERYDVPALADPNGRYGRWNLPGIIVYTVGVLVQMPFISTKLYTGPMVAHLGGVDLSWIIGLVVPSVLYYCVARGKAAQAPSHMILPEAAKS